MAKDAPARFGLPGLPGLVLGHFDKSVNEELGKRKQEKAY